MWQRSTSFTRGGPALRRASKRVAAGPASRSRLSDVRLGRSAAPASRTGWLTSSARAARAARPAGSGPSSRGGRTPPPTWGSDLRGEGAGQRRLAWLFAGRGAAPPPPRRSARRLSAASSDPCCRRIVRRLLRPDARRAREPVGGIAAQRDEVRHLLGLDAVALAHLGRADARELAETPRTGCRIVVRGLGELEEVAVGGGDESCSPPRFVLGGDGGGEEVVRLVAGRLGRRRSRRRATSCGSMSSCSSSASSNSRPLW